LEDQEGNVKPTLGCEDVRWMEMTWLCQMTGFGVSVVKLSGSPILVLIC